LMFGWLRSRYGGFEGAMLAGGGLYVAAGLLALVVRAQKLRPREQSDTPEANALAAGARPRSIA
jgi:hypothetical protein